MIDKRTSKTTEAWLVRRRIKVPSLAGPADADRIEHLLADMEGVLRVSADPAGATVGVDYLLTGTDYQSLERVLEYAGFPPSAGRLVPEPGR